MKPSSISAAILVVSLLFAPALLARSHDSANQSAASPAPSASAAEVPRLIKFSGTLLDAQDRPMAGPVGVTFALYSQQTGGAALWLETQNVKPDASGNYTVLLGANSAKGVPAELFTSNEARWLGIQVGQQPEHERILLVSVPYALKAGDAETLGGLPASAFVTTATAGNAANSAGGAGTSSSTALTPAHTQSSTTKATSTPQPAAACTGVTSNGSATTNSIALFTTACNVQSSLMTQASINGFPGVNLAGNNAGLLLNGAGTHQLAMTGATSVRMGQDANGFFFASDTNGKAVRFLTNNGTLNEWMRITSAGDVGIGTTTPGAKLEIAGGNLALPNTTAGGAAGVVTLGGTPFLHNFGINNTFVGASAGNTSMTGSSNTAVGANALNASTTGNSNAAFGASALQNTTGGGNAAFGAGALFFNTTGFFNSAFGLDALTHNTTACCNSAFGNQVLLNNMTGSGNNAFGYGALGSNSTGSSNNAFGEAALNANMTGAANNAFGNNALQNLTSGDSNAAIGTNAGVNLTTGSSNIYIGNAGVASESNIIRIGSTQTATFLAGTITGNGAGLTGVNATTATTATSFTGSLAGEVTGMQGATVVSNAVTPNTANAIVRRDASGNFSAGSVTLSGQLVSTVATGVAPLVVNSLSQVTNLNAQFLGGFPPAAFATLAGGNNFTGNQSVTGNISLTGNLGLPNTTSATIGVITLGGTPFLHNFGINNTFVGASAGNTSMTGSSNTAVGANALNANTTFGANTAVGAGALQVNTTGAQNTALGAGALQANTAANFNTAVGASALNANTVGASNTAVGVQALQVNTAGTNNTAVGAGALPANTGGGGNTALGMDALEANTMGNNNTAVGANALSANNLGSENTAVGQGALFNNKTGVDNAAVGLNALLTSTGSRNVAFGANAGVNVTTGNDNIHIGHAGGSGDTGVIRIGTGGTQTQTFIAGISGVNVSGAPVLVSSSGQLGVAVSSRRYKDDIDDMAGESDLLMKLRPVSFYYKPDLDPTHTRQYGLVAEEVAQVAPQLVVFDKDGAPQTVRYHFVNAMLLNEVQKQRQLVEEQQSTIARQQAAIKDLAARLAKLEALVAPVPLGR